MLQHEQLYNNGIVKSRQRTHQDKLQALLIYPKVISQQLRFHQIAPRR